MKNLFLLLMLIPAGLIAQKTKITIADTETGASFRSLSVVNDSIVWMGGSFGMVCLSSNGARNFQCATVEGYDSSEFRSIYAFDDKNALICNIGSPANILRTSDGGQSWEIVFANAHEEAFIDGIDFWDEKNGVCIGDPINGKLMVLRTGDGGRTWEERIGDSRPLLVDNEACFAASGTSVRCYDSSRVIVATGGELSRLLASDDKGTTWRTIVTPMLQESSSTGIFSIDFKNQNEGIIVGGDYKRDTLTLKHVYYTSDGGTTWNAPNMPTRGYRECVQYLDDGIVMAVGPGGMDVSYDKGHNWEKLSDEKKIHVVRKSRMGNLIVIAGGDGKVGTIEIEKKK